MVSVSLLSHSTGGLSGLGITQAPVRGMARGIPLDAPCCPPPPDTRVPRSRPEVRRSRAGRHLQRHDRLPSALRAGEARSGLPVTLGDLRRPSGSRRPQGRREPERQGRVVFLLPAAEALMLERLDKWDRDEEEWLEIVVEDRNATPADVVRVRLDFAAWLKTLPRRDRKVCSTWRRETGPERSHVGTTSPMGAFPSSGRRCTCPGTS